MREEYELEVLEKYDIEVKSTRRIRGAFFCIGSELKSGRAGDFGDCLQSRSVPFGAAGDYDTKERPMLLKETKLSERRALFLYDALSEIERCGNVKVDTPVFTKEGELRAASREGAFYMLKKWYQGRECDVRQEQDVVRAAAKLAVLHKDMEKLAVKIRPGADVQGKNPVEEVRRYNRELKKIRSFIRSRPVKNDFEILFLENFEKMYRTADDILARMETSGCRKLFEESVSKGSVVHGDYNYHNLIMLRDDIAVTDFEHMHTDIQIKDFCYFLRKAMEKNQWKQKTGQKILEAYEEVRPLSDREKEFAALSLAYPGKFKKIAGSYYRSNKAHLSEKNVEKLQICIRQTEEKYEFLSRIFPLNL